MKNSITGLIRLFVFLSLCVLSLVAVSIYFTDIYAPRKTLLALLSIIPSLVFIYTIGEISNSTNKSKILFVSLGILITVIAGILNSSLSDYSKIKVYSVSFFYLISAPVEEGIKIIPLIIKDRMNSENVIIEYALIGSLIGLGFGLGENMINFVSIITYQDIFLSIMTVLFHSSLGAMIGVFIGLGRNIKSIRYIEGLIVGAIITISCHATYNSLIIYLEGSEKVLFSFVYIIVVTSAVLYSIYSLGPD